MGMCFLMFGFTGTLVLGDCRCERVLEGETTHWGGNEAIVDEQKPTLKVVQGVVENAGMPLRSALVEVFVGWKYAPTGKKRVAACKTAEDGKFCFTNLRSGKYEIRSSIGKGWDVTHVLVTVDIKNGKDASLDVAMQVAT